MNEENIYTGPVFPSVIIAPLDWGLGHATRCIPIIHILLKHHVSVFIAADGATKKILQKEFPNLNFLSLNGYKIAYPGKKGTFLTKMLLQAPRIMKTIRYERKWLAKAIEAYKIHAVISDNRFGLQHKNVKSIYITHQLHIETGYPFLNKIAQKIHYRFINRFDECWVPDAAGEKNLAGILSHPKKLPAVPVKYLGPLSRFKKNDVVKTVDILCVLSGPEPQRTIFEEILVKQSERLLLEKRLSVTIVRGLPKENDVPVTYHPGILFFNHLPADELSNLISQSKIVICRSGYSSIMDLVTLKQKAALVATPGQTEQEYLAASLSKKKMFITNAQSSFLLKAVLSEAENFVPDFPEINDDGLEKTVTQFLYSLLPAL